MNKRIKPSGSAQRPRSVRAARMLGCVALTAVCSGAMAVTTLEKIAQSGEITLGYQNAPPFAYLANGQPIGYSIDICQKVVEAVGRELHRTDLKVSYRKVTIASRVKDLADGNIDLECANSANTAVMRNNVAFTIPTFFATTRMMVKEGSGIKSWTDLKDKRVNTITGSSAYHVFRTTNDTRTLDAVRVASDDFESSFALIENDKVDAFLMDDALLASMRAFTSSKTKYVLTPTTFSVEPLALMMRKDDPKFKKLVDDEVTKLIQQGAVSALYHKWFESPIPPKNANLKLPMSYMLIDSFKAPTDWVPN